MNKRTLRIPSEGTILYIKVEGIKGEFEALNTISLYEENGELVIYSSGRINSRIPMRKVEK